MSRAWYAILGLVLAATGCGPDGASAPGARRLVDGTGTEVPAPQRAEDHEEAEPRSQRSQDRPHRVREVRSPNL